MKKIVSMAFSLLMLLWLVTLLVFAAWFVHDNAQQIQVSILGFMLPQKSAAAYLVFSFILGGIVGGVLVFLVMQKRLFSSHRRLKKARKETDRLKDVQPPVETVPALSNT